MKHTGKILLISLLSVVTFSGCHKESDNQSVETTLPPLTPIDPGINSPQSNPQSVVSGKVLSTKNAGRYTFIELDSNGNKIWVASQQTNAVVDDTVEFVDIQPMVNFYSKSLDKTFEKIYFVGSIKVNGKWSYASPTDFGMEHSGGIKPQTSSATTKNVSTVEVVAPNSIKKAQNGYTIEELFQKKETLNGKKTSVRGKVTKFLTGIMGKNFIHLKDGTGQKGSDDLTMTTADKTVKVGDTIIATGVIIANKDFGAGYKYDLIMEDVEIKVE